ncbi:MAG: nuclear transport factor 2 family protein [Candidatus Nitrosocosmicus sp.]|nr:nuclear transport factor 2 family protein [Candidatus Nitrosocosmicus sp.]MDN5867275.1 nuclear transport factor 2 family protein [Candidatus Nitrosocosmicus sp.]
MEKNDSSQKSAKDIIMEYFQAADRQDWQSARGYLSDNLSYVSPVNSFDRAETYLKYFEHQYQIRGLTKLDVKKVFADGNDVCLLQEYNSQIMCF